MITTEQALTCRMFHHVTERNADGTPRRFRANGKCKTWKTRPGQFRVPVKNGMYVYGYITHDNADQFVAA